MLTEQKKITRADSKKKVHNVAIFLHDVHFSLVVACLSNFVWQAPSQTLCRRMATVLCFAATRYTVRLMYEQVAWGTVHTDEQLMQRLAEFDDSWYIGVAGSAEWSTRVRAATPNLFSIFRGDNTYRARGLTLGPATWQVWRMPCRQTPSLSPEGPCHTGREEVNRESTLARWARAGQSFPALWCGPSSWG